MFAYQYVPHGAPNPIPIASVAPPNPYCTIHVDVNAPGAFPLVLNTPKDVAALFEGLAPAVQRGDQQLHLRVPTHHGT